MKKWILILAWLASSSVWAADAAKGTESAAADKTTIKQEQARKEEPKKKEARKAAPKKAAAKKPPGKMKKAGSSVKSGWHKLTRSVKQGAKKPACTPAQRSMNQCK